MDAEQKVTPPDWRALLTAEVAHHPRGRAGVAERLGVSRAYVSRALNAGAGGSGYAQVPKKFITRVLDRLVVVAQCPATGLDQPRTECRRIACNPAPTHNPLAMRIWIECQRCPYHPGKETK